MLNILIIGIGDKNMNKREMKVYRGSTKDYEPVPKITIQGKWLDELGFSIGDRFTVICKKGELVISKSQSESGQ